MTDTAMAREIVEAVSPYLYFDKVEEAVTAAAAVIARHIPQPSELADNDARLILRLAGVRNELTPGAIDRADLDGMAFTVGEAQDRVAELSTQIAQLKARCEMMAGALDDGPSLILELIGLFRLMNNGTSAISETTFPVIERSKTWAINLTRALEKDAS